MKAHEESNLKSKAELEKTIESKLKEIKQKTPEFGQIVQETFNTKLKELKPAQNSASQVNEIQKSSSKFNENKILTPNKSLAFAIGFGALCGGISPTSNYLKVIIGILAGSTAYSFFNVLNKNNDHSKPHISNKGSSFK